jgi:hypothetical protein
MSEQQPSSGASSEPPFGSSIDLMILLYELINKLNQMIQLLHNSNLLNDDNALCLALRKIIYAFFKRTDIQKIDIFAVLNSLRQMDDVSFEHDSKQFKYCFSMETSLTVEGSKITITINSKIIIDFLKCILQPRFQIIPKIQEDLIRLMYMDILRKLDVSPQIPNFEMTIETNYLFWCNFIGWNESMRIGFLKECRDQLTRQPFFSKKDTDYYRWKLSKKPKYQYTPESLREFFDRPHVWNNKYFRNEFDIDNYLLNFSPMLDFAFGLPDVLPN